MWLSIIILTIFLATSLPHTLAAIREIPGLIHIEGAVLNMGSRMWHGESAYPDPFLDKNISFLYGPLAPALLGGAYLLGHKYFGHEMLAAPRIVSMSAAFLCGVAIGYFVYKRRGAAWGIWSALAWIAIQDTFASYFYLARIDSISNLFIILSIVAGVNAAERKRGILTAAFLISCALLCRQIAAAPWLILCCFLAVQRRWRDAILYFTIPAAACAAALVWLDLKSNGWSSKYVFSAGMHAWALPETAAAFSRLFISPEMWFFWMLYILGLRRAPKLWTALSAVYLIISIVHACRWAALTVSLAPGLALCVPIAAFSRAEVNDRKIVRMLAAAALLAFSAALFFVTPPGWGSGADRGALDAKLQKGSAMLEAVRQRPGRILVNGFQEFGILNKQFEIDDIHSALGPDTAGDAVLEVIATKIEKKEYSAALVSPEELRTWAESVVKVRGDTGARLFRCADALEKQYRRAAAGALATVYEPI
ncbi:MAG: hypothetical protein ACKVS6_09650 [Planctomycetota bacterium]